MSGIGNIRRTRKETLMKLEHFENVAARGKSRFRILAVVAVFAIIAMAFIAIEIFASEDPALPTEAAVPEVAQTLPEIDEDEVRLLARLIWAEARGVTREEERAAVAWCALNRLDDEAFAGDTLYEMRTERSARESSCVSEHGILPRDKTNDEV